MLVGQAVKYDRVSLIESIEYEVTFNHLLLAYIVPADRSYAILRYCDAMST